MIRIVLYFVLHCKGYGWTENSRKKWFHLHEWAHINTYRDQIPYPSYTENKSEKKRLQFRNRDFKDIGIGRNKGSTRQSLDLFRRTKQVIRSKRKHTWIVAFQDINKAAFRSSSHRTSYFQNRWGLSWAVALEKCSEFLDAHEGFYLTKNVSFAFKFFNNSFIHNISFKFETWNKLHHLWCEVGVVD